MEIPPAHFTSQGHQEAEWAHVFSRSWLLVPGVDLAAGASPGSLLGRPVFHAGGRLYSNVCTHAWHLLVARPQRTPIVCPQHGRTFDGEGRCLGQPGVDKEALGGAHLRSYAAATWGPLTFGSLGQPATPPVPPAVEATLSAAPLDALTLIDSTTRVLDGNWKLHAQNYLDTLHIPHIHGGGLARAVDLASYQTEVHEEAVLQWAYARDPALGFPPSWLHPRFGAKAERVFALWWFVYPNLTLNFYPWGLSVNAYEPIGPTQTRFHWCRYGWDEAKASRMEAWHMDGVDDEDVRAIASVQDGLASPDARPLAPLPQEVGLRWFHGRLAFDLARPEGSAPSADRNASGPAQI